MVGRLQDKVAIVTGASGGLGRAIAFAYHEEGARVVCADVRETSRYESSVEESTGTTQELIKQKGGQAIFVQVDVTNPQDVESLVQKAVAEFGRLDVMVNNAGVTFEGGDTAQRVWDTSLDVWNKTLAVNTSGVFYGIKYASSQMLEQDPHPSGDRGWIINTASIYGLVGDAGCVSYCASKGAVVNLTRAAAMDCAPKRIHVNCICPGHTASAMTLPLFSKPEVRERLVSRYPFAERVGEPEDLARACVFLASEDARWVTGVALPVDGGFTAR